MFTSVVYKDEATYGCVREIDITQAKQKEMHRLIDSHGGAVECQKSDKVLSQLLKESSHLVETGDNTLRQKKTTTTFPNSNDIQHSW